MPLILAPADYTRWLSDEPDPGDLMRPFPAEPLRMWPISTRVNKPENDDPSIIERIALATSAAWLNCALRLWRDAALALLTLTVRSGDRFQGGIAPALRTHSITSSARTSSAGAMVIPSVLAVLRLTTSSSAVGNSIGRSPGFAPLKTLSMKVAARR